MSLKHLMPMSLRNMLRPTYQRVRRRWSESTYAPTPQAWRQARQQAWKERDFDALLDMASREFGITQVRSEIKGLVERLQTLGPKTVVEVGTHKGGNSFLFCHALSTTELVIGVDLCVQNGSKLVHFARPGQRFIPLHGNSQTHEMRRRVEKALAGRKVDFLFIDGDHSYEGVKADYEIYAPLVRPGGIIAFHDIVADHRTRFGKETGCYAGDVHRFWAEVKAGKSSEELVGDSGQDGFGIGVLHVG